MCNKLYVGKIPGRAKNALVLEVRDENDVLKFLRVLAYFTSDEAAKDYVRFSKSDILVSETLGEIEGVRIIEREAT